MKQFLIVGVGSLSLLVSACGPQVAPNIRGEIVLAPGTQPPQSGILEIEAGSVTRASEDLRVDNLRLAVKDLKFPYSFELEGKGGPVGNLKWGVMAYVLDDGDVGARFARLMGSETFNFDCEESSPGERLCHDAKVRIELKPVQR